MTSPELERLAEIGALKREPPSRREFEGLVRARGQAFIFEFPKARS